MLIIITIILSFCSVIYELVFAQILSALFGDTVGRYSTTMGLYIAALGFGSLLYYRYKIPKTYVSLIRVEGLIALIGALGPFVIFFLESLLRQFSIILNPEIISNFLFVSCHIVIIAIGLLSGLELPLLMDLGEKHSQNSNISILAFDYVGTFIGFILFPILLLPELGLIMVALVAAMLNGLVNLFLILRDYKKRVSIEKGFYCLISLILIGAVFRSNIISDFILERFYLIALN